MEVTIKNIETILHQSIENEWGVRITMLCGVCKGEYHLDFFNLEEADLFMKGVKEGIMFADQWCKKCTPALTDKISNN